MSQAPTTGTTATTSTSAGGGVPGAGSDLVAVTEAADGVTVVEFVESRILDEANITEIGTQVNAAVDRVDRPRLLLDFSNVDHMSSAALGMLLSARTRIQKKNGELRLCGIKRQIQEIFAITKLDKLFKIYPDRAAAQASFGPQRTDVR